MSRIRLVALAAMLVLTAAVGLRVFATGHGNGTTRIALCIPVPR